MVKKVRSFSSDTWIMCCWFECEKSGTELHKSVLHEHLRTTPCENGEHVTFIFCSDQHKRLYQHSHVDMGNLPPGYRKIT
jgi:hypothetical protein